MLNGSIPLSRILRLTDAGVTVAIADAGTNGLAVDKDGNLIAARHSDGSISKFDLSNPSNVTALATEYMATRFNSPNDLAVRSDGNVYFTDPSYQNSANPQGATRSYRIAPGGAVSVVDADKSQPNGVTLSLDENTLYVNAQEGLFKYTVNADGSTTAGTLFSGTLAGGDGMTLDCAGNLYVTNDKRVTIVDSGAHEVGHIDVPSADNITNVAFGGPQHTTLYITYLGTEAGLYEVELNVPGLPY
jgi:gluconolactonase